MTFGQWWQSVADERMKWSRYQAAENAWIAGVLAERAARPEPDAEMLAALELAKDWIDGQVSSTWALHGVLARALLRSHGREE